MRASRESAGLLGLTDPIAVGAASREIAAASWTSTFRSPPARRKRDGDQPVSGIYVGAQLGHRPDGVISCLARRIQVAESVLAFSWP